MGQVILGLAGSDDSLEVVGILEAEARIEGDCVSLPVGGKPVPVATSLETLKPPPGSVLIEFSTPEATMTHVARADQYGLKMVIGTTGLSDDDMKRISDAAQHTAILVSSNMSIGVNMLVGLVAATAAALPDFDIEIVETHHMHKKDAPSGTALTLAESAARARSQDLGEVIRHGRQGFVGERMVGEIGMHALRGGDIVGEHMVTFVGRGERIELTHRAHNRDIFATGALRAAKFLSEKQSGLYSMSDVLGI
jgi:4-hydroxy-tetrahydrodipicolinate reductase